MKRLRAGLRRSARITQVVALRLVSPFDFRDALFLIGSGLVTYGLALIYVPVAYIVPGALLIGLALWRVK